MDMDAFTSTVALPDASVDAGTHPFSVLDAQPLPEGERHALKPRTIRLTPTRAPDPPIPAPDIAAPPPVTVRPSLTMALLQARESAMLFFRPSLNRHGLTEQQWRIIRVLRRYGELESHQLAELVCILKPSMTGVLQRMERDGLVQRRDLAACRGAGVAAAMGRDHHQPRRTAVPARGAAIGGTEV